MPFALIKSVQLRYTKNIYQYTNIESSTTGRNHFLIYHIETRKELARNLALVLPLIETHLTAQSASSQKVHLEMKELTGLAALLSDTSPQMGLPHSPFRPSPSAAPIANPLPPAVSRACIRQHTSPVAGPAPALKPSPKPPAAGPPWCKNHLHRSRTARRPIGDRPVGKLGFLVRLLRRTAFPLSLQQGLETSSLGAATSG